MRQNSQRPGGFGPKSPSTAQQCSGFDVHDCRTRGEHRARDLGTALGAQARLRHSAGGCESHYFGHLDNDRGLVAVERRVRLARRRLRVRCRRPGAVPRLWLIQTSAAFPCRPGGRGQKARMCGARIKIAPRPIIKPPLKSFNQRASCSCSRRWPKVMTAMATMTPSSAI